MAAALSRGRGRAFTLTSRSSSTAPMCAATGKRAGISVSYGLASLKEKDISIAAMTIRSRMAKNWDRNDLPLRSGCSLQYHEGHDLPDQRQPASAYQARGRTSTTNGAPPKPCSDVILAPFERYWLGQRCCGYRPRRCEPSCRYRSALNTESTIRSVVARLMSCQNRLRFQLALREGYEVLAVSAIRCRNPRRATEAVSWCWWLLSPVVPRALVLKRLGKVPVSY